MFRKTQIQQLTKKTIAKNFRNTFRVFFFFIYFGKPNGHRKEQCPVCPARSQVCKKKRKSDPATSMCYALGNANSSGLKLNHLFDFELISEFIANWSRINKLFNPING